MMVGLLLVLLGIVSVAFVWVLGLYTRVKLDLNRTQAALDRNERAIAAAKASLTALSHTSIPGVTDAAIRGLDFVDTLLTTGEK